jgi:hypothetical protein
MSQDSASTAAPTPSGQKAVKGNREGRKTNEEITGKKTDIKITRRLRVQTKRRKPT